VNPLILFIYNIWLIITFFKLNNERQTLRKKHVGRSLFQSTIDISMVLKNLKVKTSDVLKK